MCYNLPNMNFPETPQLHGFEHLYDEHAQEVFERWRTYTADDIAAMMPTELQSFTNMRDESIRFVDLVPNGDFDENHVLSLRLPIANGWRPHMFMRAKLLQELLPVPERVRVFPNDTRAQKTLDVSEKTLADLNAGNFGSLAELQQESLDYDTDLSGKYIVNDLSGYSLGGTVALAQAGLDVPTRSLDYFEIATAVSRTEKQLNKDTLNGSVSLRKYNEAMIETGIPALAEAFGVTGPRTSVRQFVVGGVKFGLDTMLATNKAIKTGLTRATAEEDLEAALEAWPEITVVQARGGDSKVMPADASEKLAEILRGAHRHDVLTAEGYAHEAGDNIWLPALASRRARLLALQ